MEDEVLGLLSAEECNKTRLYTDKTRIYGMLGEACQRTGNIFKARMYKEMSKNVCDERAYPQNSMCRRDKFTAYDNLAGIYKHVGDSELALTLYLEMIKTLKENSELMGLTLKGIGDCLFVKEDFNAAASYYTNAHQILKKSGKLDRVNEVIMAIANVSFATRKYTKGIETIDADFDFSKKDAMLHIFCAVSLWAHAREIRVLTDKNVDDVVLHKKMTARSEKKLKEAIETLQYIVDNEVIEVNKVEVCIFMSDVTLWCAYATYDAHCNEKSIEYLQKYLDIEIMIGGTSCTHCKQMKACGITMLKCSICNVTRFCNKLCQKASYTKQTWLNKGVMISHKNICPLLQQWRQLKKGNAAIEACVEQQMIFLETCHPFQNITQRGEFVDEFVYK
jgi:tetratricopeptide (TPR) repeat protein